MSVIKRPGWISMNHNKGLTLAFINVVVFETTDGGETGFKRVEMFKGRSINGHEMPIPLVVR
jgi:hypothetical protein